MKYYLITYRALFGSVEYTGIYAPDICTAMNEFEEKHPAYCLLRCEER